MNARSRRLIAGTALLLATTVGTVALSDLASDAEARPPTSSAPPGSPESPSIADGRHFGRLRAAYVAPDEIVFDAFELIPGDTEDGAYTIRDIGGGNVSIPVGGDVEVTTVSCDAGCVGGVPTDYATLTLSVEGTDSYWITVEDGLVVRIDEQYLA